MSVLEIGSDPVQAFRELVLRHAEGAGRLGRQRATAPQGLQQISAAWLAWAADPDGWFQVPHGEIPIRIPPAG